MRYVFFLCLLICGSSPGFAQSSIANVLVADLDFDRVPDSVFFNEKEAAIICKLSTQQFKTIKSMPIANADPVMCGIKSYAGGFEFFNHWMRSGYSAYFKYDVKLKAMRMIAMSRYELGNAENDGTGQSSINLTTHTYEGFWNYYDQDQEKAVKMPLISSKMALQQTPLQNFSDQQYQAYFKQCNKLFERHKSAMQQKLSVKKN